MCPPLLRTGISDSASRARSLETSRFGCSVPVGLISTLQYPNIDGGLGRQFKAHPMMRRFDGRFALLSSLRIVPVNHDLGLPSRLAVPR